MATIVELHSHFPPLIDISWWTHPGIKIFYGDLVWDTDILVEAPSEIQKDFLAPDFYLNCFFVFVSFFYSIKEYCY